MVRSVNPDDRIAELEALLKLGIPLIERERLIVYECNKEVDGIVRDYEARRLLAKYDRWLKRARAQVRP